MLATLDNSAGKNHWRPASSLWLLDAPRTPSMSAAELKKPPGEAACIVVVLLCVAKSRSAICNIGTKIAFRNLSEWPQEKGPHNGGPEMSSHMLAR